MHILNSAHIGVAFFAGLFVLTLGLGICAVIQTLIERRHDRAHIEPAECETSYYTQEHDHD